MYADSTELRPIQDDDAALLSRWRASRSSSFDDFAAAESECEQDQPLPPPEGLVTMMVLDGTGRPIGTVQWHPVRHGPTRGSVAFNIGISLQPDARGQGHGARAQALLATHLFDRHQIHRIEAATDIENLAEQGALERAGFRRDGVCRGAQWRAGEWHALVVYSRLRTGDAVAGCQV